MTSEPKLYFSADFVLERTKDYTLLIQLNSQDFSFAVTYQNTLLALAQNYALNELKNPEDLVLYLDQDYKEVIIGIVPHVFNIVPKALYKEELVAEFARILDVTETDKVYSQSLDTDNQVIFKNNDDILPSLVDRYTNNRVTFYHKGWLKALQNNNPSAQNVYVDVQNGAIHIVKFLDAKLRFYNSFSYKDNSELAYFIALVIDDLQLNVNDIKLIISGDTDVNDEIMKGLAEYFPNIKINTIQQIGHLLNHIPPQHLLSLTALTLCA